MANWNLRCPECGEIKTHVVCSMFDLPYCECGAQFCLASSNMLTTGTNIFPFTVNHVNGKPMTITNLKHLRQVESDYGVAFSAFNKDNVNDLDGMKDLPKFKG